MVSQRTFTKFFLVAALGLSAGAALLVPAQAQADGAEHKKTDAYDCDKTPSAKLTNRAAFVAACKAAKVTTYGGMGDLMEDWKKASTQKVGKDKTKACKDCHTTGNGLKGIKDNAIADLPAYMSAAGVK